MSNETDPLLLKLVAIKDEILAKTAADKAEAKADMDKVNKELARLDDIWLKDIKQHIDQVRERNVSLGLSEKEVQRFDFGEAVKGIAYGWKGKDGSFERDVMEAARTKSTNGSEGAAGGYLIPTEISSEIIDLAMANIVTTKLGCTVYKNLYGELPIPKVTGRPTMYWVGEEEAPTESGTTFGEIVLRPKTAAAFTKISRKVIYQTKGVADRIVRDQLAKAFAIGLDTAFINGLGNEKQPLGMLRTAGTTADPTGLTTGQRFTFTAAAKMVAAIDNANMLTPGGKYSYLMHPNTKWGLKMEKIAQFSGDTAGEFVINPMISDAMLAEMLGYSIATTTLMPVTSNNAPVMFGDFSQFIQGFWGGMELKASEEAGNASGSAYTQRQVWLIGFQDTDMNCKDATGVVKTAADVLANLSGF
jgi:HK97 family phage major capsid protein